MEGLAEWQMARVALRRGFDSSAREHGPVHLPRPSRRGLPAAQPGLGRPRRPVGLNWRGRVPGRKLPEPLFELVPVAWPYRGGAARTALTGR
jgi:hypothetical protein